MYRGVPPLKPSDGRVFVIEGKTLKDMVDFFSQSFHMKASLRLGLQRNMTAAFPAYDIAHTSNESVFYGVPQAAP
jgi:hypothetical protein